MTSSDTSSDSENTPYVYEHAVAVCTLDSEELQASLNSKYASTGLIVAPLRTENLGIEQIITFAVTQPKLRVIVLCGTEPTGPIGYFSGGTLLALAEHGIDETHRVNQAPGQRPILQNITPEAIERFRQQVTLVNCVGWTDLAELQQRIEALIQEQKASPPEELPHFTEAVQRVLDLPVYHSVVDGSVQVDPSGYVIISVDAPHQQLIAKHYDNAGYQLATVTGANAKAIYMGLLNDAKAISRMDHAAYMGKELARAEAVLHQNMAGDAMSYYVQDCGEI